jgi:hypothetical protein
VSLATAVVLSEGNRREWSKAPKWSPGCLPPRHVPSHLTPTVRVHDEARSWLPLIERHS